MATGTLPKVRISSLDQFRGYTVAGMFLVNYLGGFFACPFVLQHHNTYCSYADTIMPGFFFAVGFSLRLSFGRRAIEQGLAGAYWHVAKRLFGLALVAIFISHQGSPNLHDHPFDWDTMKHLGWNAFHDPLKRDWFQTLMHIAVTSLWILPVIRLAPLWRVLYMLVSAGIHVWLSGWFYFDWVNGVPNPPTGIDGGPLGFLTWTIPTMIGTLACDAVMTPRSRSGLLARLFIWGIVLMGLGWLLSCGTRWYDVAEEQVPLYAKEKLAKDPVVPSNDQFQEWSTNLKQGHFSRVLAEPPFVPPPHSRDPKDTKGEEKTVDHSELYRKWNYWMMSQRAGTVSYLTFGAGFSLALYGLFYLLADMVGLRIGVFRTLGTNALVGYILHEFTGEAVKKFVPRDAPGSGMPVSGSELLHHPLTSLGQIADANAMWLSFALFFFITWLFVRSLEKKGIFIKL